MTKITIQLWFAACCVVFLAGADWIGFRGLNGSGVADEERVPTSWSVKENQNISWKAELPGRGASCPIVIGHQVLVTCCGGYRQDQLHVICLDAGSGRRLWHRQLWATGRTMTHGSINPATPTPTSDGERVFAYFSTNDVACFDLDGNLLWVRGLMLDYPNASNSLGLASSPIVVGQTLVVKIETESQSLALGLDVVDGSTRWKIDRPSVASWTSPVILQSKGLPPVVLLQSGRGATAFDPDSGRPLWHFGNECGTIPSSVADGDVVYVPSNGLVALKQTRSHAPEVLWQNSRLGPSTSSPLLYRERIYIITGSVLKCADAATGELAWQVRLRGRKFSGSPVAVDGRIYVFNDDGLGHVIFPGPDKGIVREGGDIGEPVLCTPAIAGDALYVRSDAHLWKISSTP